MSSLIYFYRELCLIEKNNFIKDLFNISSALKLESNVIFVVGSKGQQLKAEMLRNFIGDDKFDDKFIVSTDEKSKTIRIDQFEPQIFVSILR